MQYKIVEIYHNGKKGNAFEPRRDGRYPLRVGRTVELEPADIVSGNPAYIRNIAENDGTPCNSTLITSNVVISANIMGFFVLMITENSIYMFSDLEHADEFYENAEMMTDLLRKNCGHMRLFVDEQSSEEND